jgi:hypothetical protein
MENSIKSTHNRSSLKEIKLLKKKVDSLSTDKALIEIFNCVDNLYLNSECHLLFTIFMNEIYNEDIYIGILSSTIYFKNSLLRSQYLEFVRSELLKSYTHDEIFPILIGL